MFGVDCRSMETFSNGKLILVMRTMSVPEPVTSLVIRPHKSTMHNNFSEARTKFTKEDPTLLL